ncbi:hypothetical protein [Streptomyces sp. NPDC005438]|uniref:hypothetical protein n=1 Tax=Streptomyces sp. NPDC005438 TaxID=3156880 RepID=UPI0033BC4C4B
MSARTTARAVLRRATPGTGRRRSTDHTGAALAEGADRCTAYLSGLPTRPSPQQAGLVAVFGRWLSAHRTREAGTDEPVSAELFDLTLQAGWTALEVDAATERALALALADVALACRRRSRGAWRLRAHALDALGRAGEAEEAWARHLELADGPSPARAAEEARLAVTREKRRLLAEAVDLLPEQGERAREFTRLVREEAPGEEVRAAFTAGLREVLAARGAARPEVRRLAESYATYCRLLAHGRLPDPSLGGVRPMGVPELRELVSGRVVRVVVGPAPAEALTDEAVVVRCGDFPARDRADLHAVSYRSTTCWDRPVTARLVCGGPLAEWREALRRVVPGAQQWLGDDSLRHPVTDPLLLAEQPPEDGDEPGVAYSVLRLLCFLDVSPRVELWGEPRLAAREREWVAAHRVEGHGPGVTVR